MVRPRTVCAEEVIKWPKSFKNMQQHLIDSVLMYFTSYWTEFISVQGFKIVDDLFAWSTKKGKKDLDAVAAQLNLGFYQRGF